MVNFLDLKKQYETIDIETTMLNIREAIENGAFVGGTHVDEFEKEFSNFCGTEYSAGVGSGTDALIFALAGLGVGPGDEVIVPANTFIATALAVSHVGATPVFVDVDPDTYLITNENILPALTDKTKAIMPVHLYGNVVDMPKIMNLAKEHDLYVVEDCAQAIGASYDGKHVGSFGDAGCFSFYPAKNLGGLGQGGALVTNNVKIVNKARCLGNVGRKEGSWYEYSDIGYNSRLDAINAIFLRENLKHINKWNSQRKFVAEIYATLLEKLSDKISVPSVDKSAKHVYHLYELRLKDKQTRDSLQTFLKEQGIYSALHYPVPCHKQEVYKELSTTTSLEVTEALADTLLSLPMHPFMTDLDVRKVCEAITVFFN